MEGAMFATNRVMRILDDFSVPYRRVSHREAFTAGQVAQESHVPPEAMAKVIVLRDRHGRHVMAVLPASARLDVAALEAVSAASPFVLETEAELARMFPDCEAGAMPPFGGAYGLPMFVDECLSRQPEICFQPGNHHETLALPFAEYERLAVPMIGQYCLKHRRDAA
jgi:Ala-tRNA(Pro) deacylase